MSFRVLAVFPLVFVALAAALLAVVPLEQRAHLLTALIYFGKLSAFVGLGAAALTFERGDYLRRGFGLSAACYACLLLRDTWLVLGPKPPSTQVEIAQAGIIVLANVFDVVGLWTMARALDVAGLELPGSKIGRRAAIGLACLASILFAGPSFVIDARDAFMGVHRAWWTAASDLGDILALPLVAPVTLTALAVRGGTLRWPWLLFSASLLGWLLYDGISTVPQLLHLAEEPSATLSEYCRLFAIAAACSAGLAQRRAVLDAE